MFEWKYNLLLAAKKPDIDWEEYIPILIIFGLVVFKTISNWFKKLLQKDRSSEQEKTTTSVSGQTSTPQPLTDATPRSPLQRLPVYARGRTQQAPPTPPQAQYAKPVRSQPAQPQPTIRPTQPRPASSQAAPRSTVTAAPTQPPQRSESTPVRRPQAPKPSTTQKPPSMRTAQSMHQSKFRTASGMHQINVAKPSSGSTAEPLIEAVSLEDRPQSLAQRLTHRDELVNAIVMAEILGKPLALRDEFMGGHKL
ncbi:MAG: hypothetical protein JW709_07820 [Sedimentisphaerales bacterium]|nr:hypothetical protein [Sedimentisphaerales bacterium]